LVRLNLSALLFIYMQLIFSAMIRIIGAGPAGCHVAYLLAKAGYDVSVYEEHQRIGEPVQCTGIVTSCIADHVPLKDSFVINRIDAAKVFAASGRHVEFALTKQNLILDRSVFDRYMADRATDAGAKIHTAKKFMFAAGSKIGIKGEGGWQTLGYDALIGADGPGSHVAKSTGLFHGRKFWTGFQARVRLENENSVEFYPDIASFAWVVPEDRTTVRIGLLAQRDVRQHLDSFLKKRLGFGIGSSDIIDVQAGLVPVYDRNARTQKNNIYLLGDAACQVKATTGGGIVPGLAAASCLAQSIIEGKDYEKAWKKKIGKELWTHSMIRSVLDNFCSRDYERLVTLCNKERPRRIIQSNDRDKLASFCLKLLFSEPRFLAFSKRLFKPGRLCDAGA